MNLHWIFDSKYTNENDIKGIGILFHNEYQLKKKKEKKQWSDGKHEKKIA